MSSKPPDESPIAHDEASSLLPWYVNGRLSETDAARVRRHLAACDECREEAARERILHASLSEAPAVDYAPQASLAKLMERVAASETRRARWPLRFPLPSWRGLPPGRGSQPGLRPLLLAVGAQSVVIVMLVLAVGWLTLHSLAPARFETLTETQQAGESGSGEVVRVVFDDATTLAQMQVLLRAIDGRVVDGPTAAGVYTIERPREAAQPNEAAAEWLRAQAGVRFAEPVARGR